jgi:carboxymethylproline synthase
MILGCDSFFLWICYLVMKEQSFNLSIPDLFKISLSDHGVLYFQFQRDKETNPISRKLTCDLIERLSTYEADPQIKAIVFTGGLHRSFSAGGDFNDVQSLSTREETTAYLNEIIDSYQAILKLTKPTLAMIDHHAIGQGLQIALMTDWRIATTRSRIAMPELKNGVACPLGATILEKLFGRARMMEDVIGCSTLDASQALQKFYFQKVVPPEELVQITENQIHNLIQYPQVSYRTTKKIFNESMIHALENVRRDATEAHVQSILSRSGQDHFTRILNR